MMIWTLIVGAIIGAIGGSLSGRGKQMGCIFNVLLVWLVLILDKRYLDTGDHI